MTTTSTKLLSLGDVADRLGAQSWRVMRVFKLGDLPEPAKAGRQRIFTEDDIPVIREAMLKRGYIKAQ